MAAETPKDRMSRIDVNYEQHHARSWAKLYLQIYQPTVLWTIHMGETPQGPRTTSDHDHLQHRTFMIF